MGRINGHHLTAEERQRIKETVSRHIASGGTATSAARELGIRACTVLKIAREMDRDPAIATGMEAVGTGIVPSGMWIKTGKDEDGVSRSIYLRPQQEATEDVLERIKVLAPRIGNAAGVGQILLRIFIKAGLAAIAAEIVGLALILGRNSSLGVNAHTTNRIFFHRKLLSYRRNIV